LLLFDPKYFIAKSGDSFARSAIDARTPSIHFNSSGIVRKLRFLIQQPTHDHLDVRFDLEHLLGPGEISEIGYLQFWECSLSRVATLLDMSSSRVSSTMREVLQILENKSKLGDTVAGEYLCHFQRIMKSAGILRDGCKQNDSRRSVTKASEMVGSFFISSSPLPSEGIAERANGVEHYSTGILIQPTPSEEVQHLLGLESAHRKHIYLHEAERMVSDVFA
jgi:hypothetical protein